MNLPNRLTCSRLGITAAFLMAASFEWPLRQTACFLLFVAAGVSDLLDGALARKFGQITDFGKLMDPLADKVAVAAALFYLVDLDIVPFWMAVVMVAREFLITGLRTLAAGKGSVLAAEKLGKHKTISQMTAIIASLLWLALPEWGSGAIAAWPPSVWLGQLLYWLFVWATVLTVASGIGYYLKNRDLIESA